MTQLGPNNLLQYALPATWDATYLRNLALQSGKTYDQLYSEISIALNAQNAAILNDPLYGGLVGISQDVTVEYRVGSTNQMEPHTEHSLPNAQRGAVSGHMLPLLPWDYAFGYTWDFLRMARETQIQADIAAGLEAVRNAYQKAVLTRLFKSTYDAVGTGKSVPLADGGTADSTYIPVAKPDRGGTFLSTHTHFKYLNGITQANLETALYTLWEHGIDAPYDMVISYADIGAWSTVANVTGWKDLVNPGVVYGSGVSYGASNLNADGYIGVITTKYGPVWVRASGRIPTGYYAIYKSYGVKNLNNPLRVRESPQFGTGAILLPGKSIQQFPLESAYLFSEFGVGVNNRVGAVAVRNDAGAYADPTIS